MAVVASSRHHYLHHCVQLCTGRQPLVFRPAEGVCCSQHDVQHDPTRPDIRCLQANMSAVNTTYHSVNSSVSLASGIATMPEQARCSAVPAQRWWTKHASSQKFAVSFAAAHLCIVLFALCGQDDLRRQVCRSAHSGARCRLQVLILSPTTALLALLVNSNQGLKDAESPQQDLGPCSRLTKSSLGLARCNCCAETPCCNTS